MKRLLPAIVLVLCTVGGAAQVQDAPAAGDRAPATPGRGARLDTGAFRYQRSLPEGPEGLTVVPLDAAVLAHSQGPLGRFGDVRIVDAEDAQIPYLLEPRPLGMSTALELRPAVPTVGELTARAPGARSFYSLTLPYENLPDPVLVLHASGGVFLRTIELGVERAADRRHRDAWFQSLFRVSWQHSAPERAPEPFELRFSPPAGRELLLIVDEGDNQPLSITSARLRLPAWQLRFHRPAGARLRLIYGRPGLSAPQYDVALLAPSSMSGVAHETAPDPEVAAPPPAALLSPRVFWAGLGGAVLALLAVIARLISTGTAPRPSPPAP